MTFKNQSVSVRCRKRLNTVHILVGMTACVLLGFQAVPVSASGPAETGGEGAGSAVVKVVTDPDVGGGTFRFAGTPAGELNLVAGEQVFLSEAGLAPGSHVSTLTFVDPMIAAAGYTLTDIRCDDQDSDQRSSGSLDTNRATFRIEAGETVTCVFVLSVPGCICPKEGSWDVTNHTGSMVCTGGPVPMTVPLKADTGSGTLEIKDNCETIVASGLSEDEASIVMRPSEGCGFKGSVGGSQDGIPMVIDFTWEVRDSGWITGDLHSVVNQSGMTCTMSRTYELRFAD